jgi:7,8-dihydropterin-6-yl-methyl-4-(beta-D-ribofuranosyl)aminobenzene 5'-phosphate synthase
MGQAHEPRVTPDGVMRLDELEILVVIDNETDTLSSVDEGMPA